MILQNFKENWNNNRAEIIFGPRVLLQLFVISSYLIIFFLDWLSPMSVEYNSFKILYVAASICLASALIFGIRGFRRTAVALESLSAGFFLIVPVLVGTYLANSLNYPLVDKELAAMDVALGVDWLQYVLWVNSNPLLATILDFSYNSFLPQMMLMPVILCLFKMPERGIAFIAGYALLCFISTIICIWYPAVGTYVYYGVTALDVPNINTHFGFFSFNQFEAVRNNPDFVLNVKDAAGIVVFPSVHVGTAFLLIWAAWASPYLRYPFLILNVLMSVSAISQANHYVVDMIAGVGVAGITAAIVSFVFLKRYRNAKSNIGRYITQAAKLPDFA